MSARASLVAAAILHVALARETRIMVYVVTPKID
jgi:hypothetical protein